jgi:methylmalonyl-CoA/ethylmalonyl-CoA epimerase
MRGIVVSKKSLYRGHMKAKLNHIGIAVRDVREAAEVLCLLGLKRLTTPEPDPIQRVLACFLAGGDEHGVHIELIEPTDETSPIAAFLQKRGGGLHHLCFEVDDIDEMTDRLKQKGFPVVSPPVECVGYDRSFDLKASQATRISFLLLPNRLLIELLQKGA